MTHTRLFSVGALALAALVHLPAQAQQQLLPAKSEIAFVSRQMGVPVEGKFRQFSAQIAFDPAKLASSNIAFSVDTGSATLGVRETDAELPKSVWFHVEQFPKATFQSSSIKRLDGNRFEVTGKLSIKGVSSPVVVPVTLTQNGAETTATGTFAIQRLTYKVGDKEWADTSMVANDVQVKFRLALTGVGKL
ncbi:YceI family protein [Hydrogenophaga sp.]|uniref:YceI family protein n=1 Tax=Hydrogenophaga sp. TaxID=1904254 RepID=UPI0035673618